MIGVALQRRCSGGNYETLIVNPYHVSSYHPWPTASEDSRKSIVRINAAQTEHVKETIDQIAQLIAVATNIKREDIPPDVYYVSTNNLITILGYIERDKDVQNHANI